LSACNKPKKQIKNPKKQKRQKTFDIERLLERNNLRRAKDKEGK
jgi:hypothetical protein